MGRQVLLRGVRIEPYHILTDVLLRTLCCARGAWGSGGRCSGCPSPPERLCVPLCLRPQGWGNFGHRGLWAEKPREQGPRANTYLFMVQARGIMLRENVKTIGHMIRLYTNKNTTLNGTGEIMSAFHSSCGGSGSDASVTRHLVKLLILKAVVLLRGPNRFCRNNDFIIQKAIIQVIILYKQQRIFRKTSHIRHTSPAQKNCLICVSGLVAINQNKDCRIASHWENGEVNDAVLGLSIYSSGEFMWALNFIREIGAGNEQT
ncbi:hypothetical protein CB1_000954012 [Camelus ferus]|nr:hypothetical protein CB1_000954012 [Camelus ferus]